MKKHTLTIAAGASLFFATSASAVTVQFGGDRGHILDNDTAADTAWNNLIGAEQIVQWNGSDSDGGNFGGAGNGSLVGGIGQTLTSLTGDITLTTRGIGASGDQTGLAMAASGTPNTFGVNSAAGTNAAQFEVAAAETWTFDINQDIYLTDMIATGMGFDGERFGIDIGADGSYEYEWNRTGMVVGAGTVAAGSFGGGQEYFATFGGSGIFIASGTDVTIAGLQGSVGLEGLVFNTVPEPSAYAMLAGLSALGFVMLRRRR